MQNNSNGMSTAALVLSIIGLLTMVLGGSIIFGSLAIVLALLSRGAGRMSGQARAGLGISIAGIIISVVILVSLVTLTLNSDTFQDTLKDYVQYYEDQYSDDSDSFYDYDLPDSSKEDDGVQVVPFESPTNNSEDAPL